MWFNLSRCFHSQLQHPRSLVIPIFRMDAFFQLVEVVMDAEKCFESIASGSKDAQPTSSTLWVTGEVVKF